MRLILAILIALGLTGPVHADEHELWPEVPKATGEPHPEGNEYWRKNHPTLLLHDRDLALREGDRDIQASIGTCFTCHAVKDEATGEPVSFEDPRNFCRVCHDFVAVQGDCFSCHRSTPADPKSLAIRQMAGPDEPDSIAAYLERLKALEAAGEAAPTEASQ